MDNGHVPVAHSPQVPPHSTLFLISKLGIIFVTSIYLSDLIDTTHVTIKQKRSRFSCVLHHWGTMTHQSIICRTSNFYYASCPFNACMLATSSRSLDSLPLDPKNVIFANAFCLMEHLQSVELDQFNITLAHSCGVNCIRVYIITSIESQRMPVPDLFEVFLAQAKDFCSSS